MSFIVCLPSFPTAGRLPVAFRSLSAAKVRKMFQKIAFYEGVNTVSTQIFCFLSKEKRYIEDGNSPRKQLNFQVSHTLYTTDYKPLDYDLAIVLFSPQRREGAEALSLFEFIEHCHRTLRGRESRSTHTLCIDLGRVRRRPTPNPSRLREGSGWRAGFPLYGGTGRGSLIFASLRLCGDEKELRGD